MPFPGVNTVYFSLYYSTHDDWYSIENYETDKKENNLLSGDKAINRIRFEDNPWIMELSDEDFNYN